MWSRPPGRSLFFAVSLVLSGAAPAFARVSAAAPATTGRDGHGATAGAPTENGSDDPLAGLEDLQAAREGTAEEGRLRSLPLSVDLRVLTPRGAPARQTLSEGDEDAGLVTLLGAGWALWRPGGEDGPRILRGPGAALSGGASAESVQRLLAGLHGILGDVGDVGDAAEAGKLELVYDRSAGPSRTVRYRQIQGGARVRGAEIAAHFDPAGLLRSVVSTYKTVLRPLNHRRLSAGEAESIAREDLIAAVPGVVIPDTGRSEAWVDPTSRGPVQVWEVSQATRRPLGWFVSVIDADTGKILSRENRISSAQRSGKANVFRSDAAYPARVSRVRLPNLDGPEENPDGQLRGSRFFIVNDLGPPVSSSKLSFLYRPFSPEERDEFDQASAYYHLERAHARFAKRFGIQGAPWFDGPAVPALVNAVEPDDVLCNAFYTPNLPGHDSPGFAFANQNTCREPNDDLVRDADIIYHEYTHGVVDWLGIDLLGAPRDSYQRAINEAVADYHAVSFTGDPVFGEVFGFSRSVRNTKLYPVDVGCYYGTMQEHCTGEIWSGFLWDVQRLVRRGGEELEFASLDYLSDHWPAGHVPGVIDFWDGVMALLEADRALNAGKAANLIYGAAASRGILGVWPFPGDNSTIVYQQFSDSGTFKSVGSVHKAGSHASFFFHAPVGRTLSVKVKSTSGLKPRFSLYEGTSGYDLFPVAEADDVTSREATMQAILPPTIGVYDIDVFGANDASVGSFQIVISVE